jgi:hypothetical protein
LNSLPILIFLPVRESISILSGAAAISSPSIQTILPGVEDAGGIERSLDASQNEFARPQLPADVR